MSVMLYKSALWFHRLTGCWVLCIALGYCVLLDSKRLPVQQNPDVLCLLHEALTCCPAQLKSYNNTQLYLQALFGFAACYNVCYY